MTTRRRDRSAPRRRRARALARGAALLLLGAACGGGSEPPPEPVATRWAEGELHRVRVEDMPAPFATGSVHNAPRVDPQARGLTLTLPPGFHVERWATDLLGPRRALAAPGGDLIVAESFALRVTLLRDGDGDGRPDRRAGLLELPTRPFGLALHGEWLYVGLEDRVIRVPYRAGQLAVSGAPETLARLSGGGHWTRDLLFSADGSRLYVAVGSRSNINLRDNEPPRRAVILEMAPDGSDERVYASGLRNPVGLRLHPLTGAVWTAVSERDGLGDDLPPDFVTSVRQGGFYGWPYAYIGAHPEPRLGGARPDMVDRAIVPDVLLQAHSAPLGLLFYTGQMFPEQFRGDLFVALHGSANRSRRTGYKVVRIPMDAEGRPLGGYRDFVSGWSDDPASPDVWGRPAGLAQLPDGSVLVLDSGAGAIWRIRYGGAPPVVRGSSGTRTRRTS